MNEKYQWVEDDATLNDPDAKKVHQAWFDIYGQEDFKAQWEGARETEEDGGDHFIRTMPNGVKVTMSFDGWYIHRKVKLKSKLKLLISWILNKWTWRRWWCMVTMKKCWSCKREWVKRGCIFFKADGECERCWMASK